MTRRKPKFRRCKCGNLIVLAHGESECAVCQLKRMGLWRDEPWEKRKTAYRLPNPQSCA